MSTSIRKSLKLPLRKLLLLTSVLFAPSVAAAQQTDPPQQPPPEVDAPAPVAQAEADAPEAGDEIVVLGQFIPEPMRQTSEVASFLSSEDLARQGDSTAASALTRLTGLSLVSGRFIFVRGLGDRYSSALLNGSPLPSPEPLRRTVPLDLFPSNILDGVTVQKTYSPNYPGEFGGGIIDLRTLTQPNEPFLNLKVGASGNTESTGKRGLFYYGENSDWTTISDGLREIPQPLAAAIATNRRIQDSNFSPAALETIGESFVNSPVTVIQSGQIDPDFDAEVSAGTSIEKNGVTLGFVAVGGYDSQWRIQNADRTTVIGNSVVTDFDSQSTTWDVVANALGSFSVGWGTNEITLTGLLVRSSSKEAQVQIGTDVNVDPTLLTTPRKESSAWYERQLGSVQLAGEHEFGNLEVEWRGAYAQSTRDAPYERDVTYDVTNGQALYSRQNQNVTRFSELTDEVLSGGVDASYTVALSEQRDAVFSAGYAYSNTVRQYELLSFIFGGPAVPAPNDVLGARVDFLFSPDNIDPLRFEIFENTGANDRYKGQLLVNAAYASADVEILPLVRAAVGVRYEEGTQDVRTGNRFGEAASAPVLIENEYYLPAATLTWNFAEDLQLRLGYSQTIARPQFRELAFSLYLDPETDREYRGNPALVDSELTNYDARLEYYFGRNQFVTFGGFYKEITSPIEEVVVPTASGLSTRFINAPQAMLYGAELEYRTRFDMPFEAPFLGDADWLFAINYTYTFSEVEAGAGATVINPSDGLPVAASAFGLNGSQLQGTPENIANLQFGYETGKSQMTLLFGWVDERIARRGLGSLPRVMEAPGINVDLVYRRDFTVHGADFTLGLSGRNLTDENHEEFTTSKGPGGLGRLETNTYDRGSTFSVSLSSQF